MIGQLQDRVEIQTKVLTTNTLGETFTDWTTQAERWAWIDPKGGSRVWNAQQSQIEVTHMVKLRHFPGLDGRYRLLLDGKRVLEIQSVINPSERGEWSEVVCVEKL